MGATNPHMEPMPLSMKKADDRQQRPGGEPGGRGGKPRVDDPDLAAGKPEIGFGSLPAVEIDPNGGQDGQIDSHQKKKKRGPVHGFFLPCAGADRTGGPWKQQSPDR